MSRNFGITGHLRAGFLGISALVVLAAGAGIYAFLEVSDSLNRITDDRVPAALAAQELSRRAQDIVAAAPTLLAAESYQQFQARSQEIRVDVERLDALVNEVGSQNVDYRALPLREMVDELEANLRALDGAVARNLGLRRQIAGRLGEWEDAYRGTLNLVEPTIRIMRERLLGLRKAMSDFEPGSTGHSAAIEDLSRQLLSYIPLQEARVKLARANDIVLSIARAQDNAELERLTAALADNLPRLNRLISSLDPDSRSLLERRVTAFRDFAAGPASVPVLRRRELATVAEAERLLGQNETLSQTLTAAVDRLVEVTDRQIEDATHAALDTQMKSAALLVAVAVLSVVAALLIMRFYVGHNVVRRLAAIRDSMLALSRGEIDHPLPPAGTDEIGRMTKALVVFRENAVRLRERTEELKSARDEAIKSSEAKSRFLANMSHELRTPLNAVIGFSEIIRDEVIGPVGQPKYREYARDIHDSAEHLLAVINDILDVAKAEAGKLELNEESIDVAQSVDVCQRLMQERAEAGDVNLEAAVPANLPRLIADPRRLKQVLLNLLSNAVKFTPPHGTVSISAGVTDDGALEIVVADDGIGMSPAELETALKPFSQVDSAVNRKVDGTGLGLPLTKHLLEMHGGTLEVWSEKDTGTRAVARLPQARVEPSPASVVQSGRARASA